MNQSAYSTPPIGRHYYSSMAAWIPASATAAHSIPFAVTFLLAYLGSITIFGKGPTYLGYPPLYWGELVLAIGLLWTLWSPVSYARTVGGLLSKMVWAYMILGAVLTVASTARWGLDAIRDAALWYYAAFYFIGIRIAVSPLANRIWKVLICFWIFAVLWGLADASTGGRLSEAGPILPWRGYSLFSNSHHELRQHMGLGAFLILCTQFSVRRPWLKLLLIPAGLAGLLVVAAGDGRGVKVGIAAGFVLVLILGFGPYASNLPVRLLGLVACSTLAIILFVLFSNVDLTTLPAISRFLDANPLAPSGTAHWRQAWWNNLITHILMTNPLVGIGFGENLSAYNPLASYADIMRPFPVRSPHNFNVTVFARMGFAGLFLWIAILVTGLGGLMRRIWAGGRGRFAYTRERSEELNFWLLMLVSTWLNASFGVLMEGPVLGIWFWFALGFATARTHAATTGMPRYRSIERTHIPELAPIASPHN